jgi:hypothetical protein
MTIKPSITCTVSQSYPLQTNGKWINDGLIKKSDLWTVKEIFGIEPWMIPRATITTITNFLKINVTKAAALNYIQTDEGSALWGSHGYILESIAVYHQKRGERQWTSHPAFDDLTIPMAPNPYRTWLSPNPFQKLLTMPITIIEPHPATCMKFTTTTHNNAFN